MAVLLDRLSALSDEVKGGSITPVQADMILNSIPKDLFEEILSGNGDTSNEFKDIAIDILVTLLPSCSEHTLERNYSLIPYLLELLRKSKEMDSLDDISRCILSLHMVDNHDQARYLHDTVDVLSSYCVENSDSFPFTSIVQRLTDCMIVLRSRSCNDYESICSHHTWPANIRTLLDRFLKTRTEMLTDDTRVRIFEMVKEVVETLGTKWFAPDVSLLILLVHLVVVQIRMCLDRPESISSRSLAIYYHILEMAIHCVEESSLLDDSMATRLASIIREAALYTIEYWVEAKEQKEHLEENVERVVYRFVSCLLAIGGAEMIPTSLMQKCSPLLLQVFQREIIGGNCSVACLLLPNLNALPRLSERVVVLLVELVILVCGDDKWKDIHDKVVLALESLNDRVDFYNSETLSEARSKLQESIPDCKLSKMLGNL